jgi:hypothetical protein
VNILLSSLLKEEHKTIFHLLDKHLKGKSKKATSAYLKKKITFLSTSFLEIQRKEKHKKYLATFKVFYAEIFKKLKDKYPKDWPEYINPTIAALIKAKINLKDDSLVEPASLNPKIFIALTKFKDDTDKNIFSIVEEANTKTDFRKLLAGDIRSMSAYINVLTDVPYTYYPYYIIKRLLEYIPLEKEMYVYGSPFLINGKKITAAMADTAKFRLKSAKKTVLKSIENIFAEFIK